MKRKNDFEKVNKFLFTFFPEMIQVYYDNVLHNVNHTHEIEYSRLHRDGDKPAMIFTDGSKSWYKNGQRHREGDEPAVIYAN